MTVRNVRDDIAKLEWFGKVLDKITDQPWFMDCDTETCDILMDMVETLPSIACTMSILLDNSEIRNPYA